MKRPRSPLAIRLIVAGGALLMVMPFWYAFVFATSTRGEMFQSPPPLWFGHALSDNIALLLERLPFWRITANSLYVALATTALALLICSAAGHAFAFYEFRFKKTLFAMLMGSMMLPAFLNMIPNFMLMDMLGWIDQPRALYVPAAASAFGVFLMRQYIASTVPRELIEAARIDGAGEFRIWWNIVLPLISPALGTLGLITFIASWNNFLGPLVVLRSTEHFTLPLALRSVQSTTNTEWGAVMAGAAIAVLPLLILYAFFSRRLIAGLTAGAVKG